MVTLGTNTMRQSMPRTAFPVAIALLLFSGSARADFDGSVVTSILIMLLGWPASIAASAFIAGETKPVLVMVCAAVLYPLSGFLALLIANGVSPSRATEAQHLILALLLLSAFWVAALLQLRRWKKQSGTKVESEAAKR